jgi:heptosyltransferase-3
VRYMEGMVSKILKFLFDLFVLGRVGDPHEEFTREKVRKILVVRNDNIGDVICSTPAIQALRESFPEAYLAVLVASYSREAIEGNPYVDEVFIYDKHKHGKYRRRWVAWWKLYKVLRSVRQKGFDLAIGLRSYFSPSQGWIVCFSGARFRLGCSPTIEKQKKFRFFYNIFVDEDRRRETHAIVKNLRMLEKIRVKARDVKLTFFIPDEEKERVDDFMAQNCLQGKLLVGLHVTCRRKESNLSEERFVELADRLIERYRAEVVLTYVPQDQKRVDAIFKLSKNRLCAFSSGTLKGFGALLERCSLFICGDGGPMHLAAATGVATIALFGKTSPLEWKPWGEKNTAMKKGDDVNMISIEEIIVETDRILKNAVRNMTREQEAGGVL